MASSPSISKTRFHARSVSLPSTSHPLFPQFDEHLCRLRASEATSLSSSSSISTRLSGLEDLYDCVDNLLLTPHTQQAFAQECQEKCVDGASDRDIGGSWMSVGPVEMSSRRRRTMYNFFFQSCEEEETQISLEDTSSLERKAKKTIQKSLKDLKSIKNKDTTRFPDKYHRIMATVTMLNKVEGITVAVFESLSYIAGTKVQSRPSSWLSSKLTRQRSVSCHGDKANKFENVDASLHSFVGCKTHTFDNMQIDNVQNQLMKLESIVEDLEEGTES